jgi:ribonuclease BN (tRNA processing enzyme)
MIRLKVWGSRGSIPVSGPGTEAYGGNTPCIHLTDGEGTHLVLDAGSGIRLLGSALLQQQPKRVDILLTHLHMDHIQGIGFFIPLYIPGLEIHIWGPASTTMRLWSRLARYMSPPLFPVRLRELPCNLALHEVPCGEFTIGSFTVNSQLICHPGPTVGFRIQQGESVVTYIPDHEPALGAPTFPISAGWTSGFALARNADLLIHDAQYDDAEYQRCIGWGHSSVRDACAFARLAGARQLMPFHHDPAHTDSQLDAMAESARNFCDGSFHVVEGKEGTELEL